jgi:hypothetical protein
MESIRLLNSWKINAALETKLIGQKALGQGFVRVLRFLLLILFHPGSTY